MVLVLMLLSSIQLNADNSKAAPLDSAQIAKKDSLLSLLNGYGQDTNRVNAYIELHMVWRLNNSDTCLAYSKKARELSKTLDYKSGGMNANLLEGIIKYKMDKYQEALKRFIDAAEYAEALENYAKVKSLCNNISVVAMAQAEYGQALKYTRKMLDINKEHFDNSPKSKCNGNLNLGIIMKEQGKFREGLNFYKKALPLAEENNYSLKHGAILDGMGVCYHKLHLLDSAKYCFTKAINIRKEANHNIGVATSNTHYAQVFVEEKNYKLALSQLKFAMKIYEERDAKIQIAKTNLTIAEVKILLGNYDAAITTLQKSLKLLEEEDSKTELKTSYKLLAKAYSGLDNNRKAYEYEIMYGDIKDTIYSGDMAEKLAEMRTQFEIEKQQEKIAHLTEKDAINEEKLEAEKAASLYKTIGFSVFVIFAIIIFIIIYRQYQVKKKSNEILQKQKEEILERNAEINAQKEEILTQRDQLELLNEDITSSIRYAKRLQDAILPPDSYVKSVLSNAFVMYYPKDIVSGDFYWVHQIGDYAMFACVDCTGHGVPGAFMSLVGNDALNLAVADMERPKASTILNYLNLEVTKRLHQGSEDNSVKDGMDIALCTINKKTLELQFAGAYNPAYIIRNGELIEIKGDPFAIGMFVGEEVRPFTNNKFQLEKGDMLYVFSDGYADQFGGPRGKKFKYKPFKQILLDNANEDADTQKRVLEERIEEWMHWEGRPVEPQIDDICIMGIRI